MFRDVFVKADLSECGQFSCEVIKNDDKDNQLINLGDEGARQKKKSALSDAWDNDGWETLNKDD